MTSPGMKPQDVRRGLEIISALSRVTYQANAIDDPAWHAQRDGCVYGEAYDALKTACYSLLEGIGFDTPVEEADQWVANIIDATSGDTRVSDVEQAAPPIVKPVAIDWDALAREAYEE